MARRVTASEAAKLLGVSRQRIYQLRDEGRLDPDWYVLPDGRRQFGFRLSQLMKLKKANLPVSV